MLTGKVKTSTSLTEIHSFHQQSKQPLEKNNFVEQMRQGLHDFSGKTSVILSGNDLTADEFTLLVESSANWQALMGSLFINQNTNTIS